MAGPSATTVSVTKTASSIERSYQQLNQWRRLATRDDKLADTNRGEAVLRSVIMSLRIPIA